MPAAAGWGAVSPPLRGWQPADLVLRTRLVLDRRGTAATLRGAIDLAARLAAPLATTERLPAAAAASPGRTGPDPTIWIDGSGAATPPPRAQADAPWPRRTRAWATSTGRGHAWSMGGDPLALTRLLRWLAADPGGRHDAAAAFALAEDRVWVDGAGGGGARGWRPVPRTPERGPIPTPALRGLERLLPARGAPPPRIVLPDEATAATVAAAANLVARLALGSDRVRPGPLGLRPGEPWARAAELRIQPGRPGPARLRVGANGAAVLATRSAAALLTRLATIDPLAVEDPLERLADCVRWPGTRPAPPGAPGRDRPQRIAVRAAWEGTALLAAAAAERRRPGFVPPARVECFASEAAQGRRRLATQVAAALGVDRRAVEPSPAYHQAAVWLAGTVAAALRGSAPRALALRVPRGTAERPASWAITALGGLERCAADLGVAPDAVTVALAGRGAGGGAFVLTADTPGGRRRLTFRPLTVPGGATPGDRSESSGLRLYLPDGRVRTVAVASDHAQAVRLYESHVLPAALAAARRDRTIRVELRVGASEPDGEPGGGAFSPLEELHEELYFRAHAAARAHRARIVVVPEVEATPGRSTSVTARLVDLGPAGRRVVEPTPELTRVELGGRGLRLTVRWPGGAAPAADARPGDGLVRIRGQRETWRWMGPGGGRRGPVQRHDPAELPVPDRVPQLVRSLNPHPGCAAWVAGRSTLGRPVVAFAALPAGGAFGSLAKAALLRPTVLLVGGHHANEVSSTGAHLLLLDHLGRGWRPEGVVVCLPLENPDGAVVHRQLAARHPSWKLHAARFNGVGEEFGGQARALRSPFGEARPRARLLARIGADVLVDDHGVPDHVWAQPLSGRSSPPYFPIAYTLPPGLLYLIGETAANRMAPTDWTSAIHAETAGRIDAEPALVSRHQRLWRAYQRYGAGLDPRAFPTRLIAGLPLQARRTATRDRRPRPARFPLAADLVTEVADETSRGRDLVLAVRAHLVADRAILATAAAATVPAGWVRGRDGWRLQRRGPCPAPPPPAAGR